MDVAKKKVFQAIVLMDTFNNNFTPVTKAEPLGFLSVAGVPLINFSLQALSVGGITEAVLFCHQDAHLIQEYIKKSSGPWKSSMAVQVVSSNTVGSVGDVMRAIDAASLVKGDFILIGINTITNINFASLLEEHKQTAKADKSVAMTLVYKELPLGHPWIKANKPICIAADGKNQKVVFLKKFKGKAERDISLPTKILQNHSDVKIRENLEDPNIAVCSSSVPTLFADNFDCQSRDDLVHALLNQDIVTDSTYYTLLNFEYAAAINNWKIFQTVSRDILHNRAYPLSIRTGAYKKFVLSELFIAKSKTAKISKSCKLSQDVLIGSGSQLGANSVVSDSFIGDNVTIGKNATITKSFIADGVVIKYNGIINNSYIDKHCIINANCYLEGAIVPRKTTVPPGTNLNGFNPEEENEKASESGTEWENDYDDFVGFDKNLSDSDSYSSDDSEDSSVNLSTPDTTRFLKGVIRSLARGYKKRSRSANLIPEINSLSQTYDIEMADVNFNVVKALLSLPLYKKASYFIATFRDVITHFTPLFANYINSKAAFMDCLKAVEESSIQFEYMHNYSGHVFHMLYDFELIDEGSMLQFYEHLKENKSPVLEHDTVLTFFTWLEEDEEKAKNLIRH